MVSPELMVRTGSYSGENWRRKLTVGVNSCVCGGGVDAAAATFRLALKACVVWMGCAGVLGPHEAPCQLVSREGCGDILIAGPPRGLWRES